MSGSLPSEIGGYRIHRVLGSGGMATVYAALQQRPRRTVAIKVMRTAAATEVAARRFRREIEFLGRLRHPYIAQVYDAGVHTEGGASVPYFVMEYVPGAKTIIEHAEQRELSLRDRLRLFVRVCAAVEHGHRNKIIHRDLKPGNILIDETGAPKVIDFGVARAVGPEVTQQTMQTEQGRLIGTIQYMAPEQLDPGQRDLDRRCDVYSLGVLLYRLLTDRLPHNVSGLPFFTAMQMIREDEPPLPSTIRAELKGDVETITLKALEKDRSRRYRSAGSLGRDIVRYLAREPIHARGASLLYRLRLLARRRAVEVRAAIVVAIVVVIAAGVVIVQRLMLTDTDETATVATERAPDPPDPATIGATPSADPSTAPAVGTSPSTPPPLPIPQRRALTAPWSATSAVAMDETGRFVFGASTDGFVGWWSLADGALVRSVREHDATVRHLDASADGAVLVSADEHTAVLTRTDDGRVETTIRHGLGDLHAMRVSADGRRVAAAGADLTVHVYDARGRERHVLHSSRGALVTLAFSADGSRLAAGTVRGDVYVWNAEHGRRVALLDGRGAASLTVGFGRDGDHVVALDVDGTGSFWRLGEADATEETAYSVDLGAPVIAASVDPVGRWLLVASPTVLRIVEAATGLHRAPDPTAPGMIARVKLGPAARWFAVVDQSGVIHLMPVD
ncbi:MAG: protein kinase [Planctomycetes bacterium]|nr:protein kinase [Planctomycetota bacterium]